jgi:hypothetical protein
VTNASLSELPPSSLLLWRKVLPAVDSVYFGDFDAAFKNQFFWSFKDVALTETFSSGSVARAGAVIASALETLAMDANTSTPIDVKVLQNILNTSAMNSSSG